MGLSLRIAATLAAAVIAALAALWFPLREGALAQYERQHDTRMQFRLQTLLAEVENRVSYGLDLAETPNVQQMLEAVRADDPDIHAIEIFTPEGLVLFGTDRVLIGDRTSPEWLAMAPGNAAPGESVVGIAIRNNLGEEVGVLLLTAADGIGPGALAQGFARDGVLVLLAGFGLVLVAGWLVARRPHRDAAAFVAGLNGHPATGDSGQAGARADALIREAEAQLDRLSQRLAGVDDASR
ncbi:MAG: cache domain-containing protein [Rubellimicrobium sp.]|nr:cache domain-containing protein [Rubellimicrobium sp.]